MDRFVAREILNRYPGLMAFSPGDGYDPPEAFLEGWFHVEAVAALAWWMTHCPQESWWNDPDPARDLPPLGL